MAKWNGPSKFLIAGAKTGLPDDVLIKIGEITLNWNRTEVALEELIWAIAGWSRTTGAFVTHDLGNVARDQLCRNLLHHRVVDQTLKSNVVTLITFTSELRTRRNNLIHSIPTAQLMSDELPDLEKRSAKNATGEIKVTKFLIEGIDSLRHDIAMATAASAYAAIYVQRDTSFSATDDALSPDLRTAHVWGKRRELPYIGQIRTRLETIRSQPQQPNKKTRPPQPSEA